jgi:hypothetical protein
MMKLTIPIIALSLVSPLLHAQNIVTVYPQFETKDSWERGIYAFAPSAKPLWTKESDGLYLGIFLWNDIPYVCAYPTDPRNYRLKEAFESWQLLDSKGSQVSFAGVETSGLKEIMMRGVVVRDDFSTGGYLYYFGRPVPMDQKFGEIVRIVLPNAGLAFDYSQKERKVVGVFSTTTSRKFEKLE